METIRMEPKLSKLPSEINWRDWIERWDKMQEKYLVRRAERIQLLATLVRETVKPVRRVLDLGCGTGSTMQPFLKVFPKAKIYGADFDPTLLPLAQERLRSFGARANLIFADLRANDWQKQLPGKFDAVISATALHWLKKTEIKKLYGRISQLLRPGGIFLNADHVASENSRVQTFWKKHRDEMRRAEGKTGEDWESFWKSYLRVLDLPGRQKKNERVLGGWNGGSEEGLPLEWQLNELKKNGFVHADCFWRCDCDAIYGGFRKC